MYIVYNCGYNTSLHLNGPKTNRRYGFKKRFVTEVDDKDGELFLQMTSKDIPWCPTNSKTIPPFMTLEDWCTGKEGRFDRKPFQIYDPDKYKKMFKI